MRGLKVYFVFLLGHCCISFSWASSTAKEGYMGLPPGIASHMARQPLHRKE